MKAVYLESYGSEPSFGDMPAPSCAADSVRIEVHASSVNPIDWKTRDGALKPIVPYALPVILGSDVSGRVTEVGSAVSGFALGDEVFSRVSIRRLGAYAEEVCVLADEVAQKPKSLSHQEAASIPLVALTAWQALVDKAQLEAGQRVLIHAGAGGVGTMAIQIARNLGAEVTTTASAKNHEALRALGAEHLIDYREQDFAEECRDFDVVFDTMGGEIRKRSWGTLRRGGILVSIAGLPTYREARATGGKVPISIITGSANLPTYALAKMRGLRFDYLMMRSSGRQLSEVAALCESAAIKTVIDSVFPLEKVTDAFAKNESGRTAGKVVIQVR